MTSITLARGARLQIEAPYALVVQTPTTEEQAVLKIVRSETDFDKSEDIHWRTDIAYFIPNGWWIRAEQGSIAMDFWRCTTTDI